MPKQITIDQLTSKVDKLAAKMEQGFVRAHENLENLAQMTARGFENTATKADISNLQQVQEDIILRLDQVAPNFDVKDLRKRVTKIESHLGLV